MVWNNLSGSSFKSKKHEEEQDMTFIKAVELIESFEYMGSEIEVFLGQLGAVCCDLAHEPEETVCHNCRKPIKPEEVFIAKVDGMVDPDLICASKNEARDCAIHFVDSMRMYEEDDEEEEGYSRKTPILPPPPTQHASGGGDGWSPTDSMDEFTKALEMAEMLGWEGMGNALFKECGIN